MLYFFVMVISVIIPESFENTIHECSRLLSWSKYVNLDRSTPVYDKHTKRNRKRHPSEILCTSCDIDYVCEDEVHFISICLLHSNIRQSLLNPILIDNPNFSNLFSDQMIYFMQFCQYDVTSYIQSAWKIRSSNSCIKWHNNVITYSYDSITLLSIFSI